MQNLQTMTLDLKAPAKINWTLTITDRRPDGYHLLQTVFQSISLSDDVRLTLEASSETDPPEIRCTCRAEEDQAGLGKTFDALNGSQNLAYKAADLFGQALKKKTLSCPHITIDIKKRIPLQAGLAGGSSDAAAVLRGLNSMMNHVLTQDELYEVASRCGADTPFCLQGGTQWGEGTGNELTPLPEAPGWSLVVVKPDGGISTVQAFTAYDRLPPDEKLQAVYSQRDWYQALSAGDKSRVAEMMQNSLEKASMDMCPEIAHVKEELLKAGCMAALMSGSGSAVFGLTDDARQEEIASFMRHKGFTGVWAVKTSGL